jgi:hypothetical protein
MFSKGTYNRYLFEIDSSHKRMAEVYERLSGRLQDPAARKLVSDFVAQITEEQKTVAEIRTVLQTLS